MCIRDRYYSPAVEVNGFTSRVTTASALATEVCDSLQGGEAEPSCQMVQRETIEELQYETGMNLDEDEEHHSTAWQFVILILLAAVAVGWILHRRCVERGLREETHDQVSSAVAVYMKFSASSRRMNENL
eukprot:TRINITY_DN4348_c0_g1_i2.p1 TRINITY_DN4348_c0_g1~~TRINITY_DN4348_c0_g1_i2.p1  ORF type:complete len:130 (-),score=32.14 TRINITY_DN4348_c0_g1_i2:95-484(-)